MKSTTSRRSFFRFAVDELVATFDEGRGRPSFKLSCLDSLADQELAALIPAIIDVSRVGATSEDFVLTLPSGESEVLFAKGSPEEDLWSRIDGRATLRQIAAEAAVQWNVDVETAFARARQLLLLLVDKQLGLPLNPLP